VDEAEEAPPSATASGVPPVREMRSVASVKPPGRCRVASFANVAIASADALAQFAAGRGPRRSSAL
jgi:hypothetical protein